MKIYLDSYFAKNLGDDILIDIILNRYPNHNFYSVSRWKNGYKYSNLKVYGEGIYGRLLRKIGFEKHLINTCDIAVTLGGSMYVEHNNSNPDYMLKNKKRYILGINFGPYKTQKYFENAKNEFRRVQDICFRDEYSYKLFKDLPNARLASDIAFGMDISNIKIKDSKKVVISVILCDRKDNAEYQQKYENKIVELIKYFTQIGYGITLMSFCKIEGDEKAIKNILKKCDDKLKSKITTYFYNGNIQQALSVLADCKIIVGTRLHSNIIGMMLGKTVIPIIYSSKTSNILKDMNFNGTIIDLKILDQIKAENMNLECKQDVKTLKQNANKHFKILDKELKDDKR